MANVRDAVRARYEKSQSYRDFLAAEAERAVQQAQAEAEVAARNAKAIADAQMQLLEELRQEESGAFEATATAIAPFEGSARRGSGMSRGLGSHRSRRRRAGICLLSLEEPSAGGFDGRTDGAAVGRCASAWPAPPETKAGSRRFTEDRALESEELAELEQEIAFRRAPEFVDHIIETLPLPANLIEFPRELVAARKARPRLAEGPLREELPPEPQLRIFEVEPEQISTEPVSAEEVVTEAPVWQGMLLDARRRGSAATAEVAAATGPMEIAPLSRRLMAGDGGWLLHRGGAGWVCDGGFVYLGAGVAGDVEADVGGGGGVYVCDCGADVSVAVLLAERDDAGDAVCAHRAVHVCGCESDAAADAAACVGAGAGGLSAGAGAAVGAAG